MRAWRAFVEQLQLRNAGAGEVIQHNSGFGIPVPIPPDTLQSHCGGCNDVPGVLSGCKQFLRSHVAVVRLFNGERRRFDENGNITIDTDKMKEAAEFYKELSQYSMPGSTEVADVKDAFVGKNTPMCMYSTYILGGCKDAGFLEDVQLAVPTKTTSAAYGCIEVLSISNTISDAETEAAKKFVSFLMEKENNEAWLEMAPGGVQPVLSAVADDPAYADNELIKPYAHLLDNVGTAFDNLQLFGSVNGKNFMAMGDITNSGVLSKALNNILVQKADISKELKNAQSEAEKLAK